MTLAIWNCCYSVLNNFELEHNKSLKTPPIHFLFLCVAETSVSKQVGKVLIFDLHLHPHSSLFFWRGRGMPIVSSLTFKFLTVCWPSSPPQKVFPGILIVNAFHLGGADSVHSLLILASPSNAFRASIIRFDHDSLSAFYPLPTPSNSVSRRKIFPWAKSWQMLAFNHPLSLTPPLKYACMWLCSADAYQCQPICLCILNHYHIFAGRQ